MRSWYVLVELDDRKPEITLFHDFALATRYFRDVNDGMVYLCRDNGTILDSDFRVPLPEFVPVRSPYLPTPADGRLQRGLAFLERLADRAREQTLVRKTPPRPNNVVYYDFRRR